MRMPGLRSTLVLLLTGLTLLAVPLEAQRSGGNRRTEAPRNAEEREDLERRIRARMGQMMRERLGLSEAESSALAQIAETYDPQRRALFRQEQALRRRVEALGLEGSGDQEEALGLLARLIELGEEEVELRRAEQEALLEVLTPIQVLQLHAFREQLGERIRRLRGGEAERRRRNRGPGDPGAPPGSFGSVAPER